MYTDYAHIEPLQNTQIGNHRIILGVHSKDGETKYVILSFENVMWTDHVNDVLSKSWHEDSVMEASTLDDGMAIEVYLQNQRYLMQEGADRFGTLSNYLNN